MRYNNMSSDYAKWSPQKLFARLRETANLESFCDSIFDGDLPAVRGDESATVMRERTRLYRESWMQPIIDELERRMIKEK